MTGIIFSIVILRIGRRHHDDTVYALSSWKASESSGSGLRPKATSQAQLGPASTPTFEVYMENASSHTASAIANHEMVAKSGSIDSL